MSSVLGILDHSPAQAGDLRRSRWWDEVEESLRSRRPDWLLAAGDPGSEQLSRDHAWVLLSWVETSAAVIANERRGELLREAAFAMSLLEASPLDRRDVMVVALLVRRAASLAELDYGRWVTAGCREADELGDACLPWLARVVDSSPSTHEEVREGSDVHFRRQRQDIDIERLERWFHGKG